MLRRTDDNRGASRRNALEIGHKLDPVFPAGQERPVCNEVGRGADVETQCVRADADDVPFVVQEVSGLGAKAGKCIMPWASAFTNCSLLPTRLSQPEFMATNAPGGSSPC